ncbi:MAG: glycosyltransferase family 87 protein [Chloroflexales bacterium]
MQAIFADWRSLMAGIQVWLAGGNPYGSYPHPVFPNTMVHVGWYAYPPPTLFLATPLALLPWPISSTIMLLVCAIGFERWVRLRSGRVGMPWLILWLPFTQGIWIGQTTMLVLVGLIWAEHAFSEGRDIRAAVLLALVMLKPQVGVLPVAWLLLSALSGRRWHLLALFAAISAALWGGAALIAGPQIYAQWIAGLGGYTSAIPDRPLLFPPVGPILGLLALLLWYRHGRGDAFGLALLVNTLIYPISVVYIAIAVAFVVIRWRRDWPWYPLVLSWIIPVVFPLVIRTPDTIAALTQAIVATGLLAGLLPGLPWRLAHRVSTEKP